MINIFKQLQKGRTWLYTLCAVAFLSSCQEDVTNYQVGENFLDDPSYVVFLDTLSIESETYMVDSIPTSGTNRIVVGRSDFDPNLGTTDVSSRFHVYPNYVPSFSTTAFPDSLVLELSYDGYYEGDTTQIQKIDVYKLADYTEPDDEFGNDTQFFYNIHPIRTTGEKLETIEFYPFPTDATYDRVVSQRLPDDLMDQLWNLVRFDDDNLDTEADFLHKELAGLVLQPNPESTQVTGFSAATATSGTDPGESAIRGPRLRLYYHDVQSEELTVDFDLIRPEYQYNYFVPTYEGTNLEPFDTDRTVDINSRTTNDEIYLQGGNGVALKLDFGEIYKLAELGLGMVTYAELIAYPKEGTYSIYDHQLPSALDAFILDQRGDVISPLLDLSGQQQIRAYLGQASDDSGRLFYSLDLTSYIRDEFLAREDTERKLALQISTTNNANSTNLDQVVFDSQFGEDEMELRIYYVVTE